MWKKVGKKRDLLKPKETLIVVNECGSEEFPKRQVLIAEVKESISMGIGIEHEVMPISLDAKKTMLESERRKAEALNMLRLREISR